jgi:hypothetical protein
MILTPSEHTARRRHLVDGRRSPRKLDELNELSVSVKAVYGGSGSFSDYSMWSTSGPSSLPSPLNDELDRLGREVYDRALALRVVGTY